MPLYLKAALDSQTWTQRQWPPEHKGCIVSVGAAGSQTVGAQTKSIARADLRQGSRGGLTGGRSWQQEPEVAEDARVLFSTLRRQLEEQPGMWGGNWRHEAFFLEHYLHRLLK